MNKIVRAIEKRKRDSRFPGNCHDGSRLQVASVPMYDWFAERTVPRLAHLFDRRSRDLTPKPYSSTDPQIGTFSSPGSVNSCAPWIGLKRNLYRRIRERIGSNFAARREAWVTPAVCRAEKPWGSGRYGGSSTADRAVARLVRGWRRSKRVGSQQPAAARTCCCLTA